MNTGLSLAISDLEFIVSQLGNKERNLQDKFYKVTGPMRLVKKTAASAS